MQVWSGILGLAALFPTASLAIVPATFDLNAALLGNNPYPHHAFYHADRGTQNASIEFQFLHIGKTGGTSLERDFEFTVDLSRAEMVSHPNSRDITRDCRQRKPKNKYIFFVRSPISRYVSGWISRFRYGSPRHPEQPAWNQGEKAAFQHFKSPAEMGCALGSSNATLRQLAEDSITSIQHTQWDLNWYWHSPQNLHACMDQVFFVGRTEHHSEDIDRLYAKLREEGVMKEDRVFEKVFAHASTHKYDHLKEIGPCARENLRRWYHNDYEMLRMLAEAGKLPKDYLDEVNTVDGLTE